MEGAFCMPDVNLVLAVAPLADRKLRMAGSPLSHPRARVTRGADLFEPAASCQHLVASAVPASGRQLAYEQSTGPGAAGPHRCGRGGTCILCNNFLRGEVTLATRTLRSVG